MLFKSECQIERTQERLLTNYYSLFTFIFELFCFEIRFIFSLELLTKKRFRFRIILIQKKGVIILVEILYVNSKEEGSQKGYEMIREALDNGAKVFGLATGSTPERLYEKLTESDVDFSNAISVNLDEYVGLPGTHEQSYRYFMEQKLFNQKPFKESHLPDGMNEEHAEIERYEAVLSKYPVDIQILGIGHNGHIAFNEPGTALDSHTHKVALTQSTINANKRFFEKESDVPGYAYTMGLASIMKAKKIVLLAFGEDKAEAVKNLVTATEPTEDIPSTVLVNHPNVTIIVDEAAASLIK